MEVADVIPAPVATAENGPRGFTLGEGTGIAAGNGASGTERSLRATLGAATGLPLPPADPDRPDTVRLTVDPAVTARLGPEGYRLTVTPTHADLRGGGPAGLFWGAQTLRQLLGPDAFRRAPLPGRTWHLPPVRIEDTPRFAWRGLLLDVARHFTPKEGVLRLLDLLAAHKLNVLHLHLTDDQGWRIEIRRHPQLTATGSWRARTKFGHRASPLWEHKPHGGHYTRDDIREIVSYAAERHITVVPEIDLPGHSQAAIAAYPELGNRDAVDTAALTVRDDWGISPHVLAPTEAVLRFYEGVLEEVLELFPSPVVHLGGDECPADEWRASALARARARELGLADVDALRSWFTGHFGAWLAARGRVLAGWDEILDGPVPDGAVVSCWRGHAAGAAAVRAGHDVVMCPEQHVYLDHRQAPGADEPVPVGYVRTLEDVYRFDPVPPGLTPAETRRVLGTQANVWTETMEDAGRVDYQVFPRLAAFAEAAWSPLPPPAERDFADFERRMATHYRRLDALGVAYRPPAGPRPWQRRPGVPGKPFPGPVPVSPAPPHPVPAARPPAPATPAGSNDLPTNT
ncbi:beta-N-acetylhexosaminidase [Streptomyces sp. NPDC005435]|uniref:beta-N-acetylhexosaminidase n=1 Tax=Streptomyces sp. NPDC005435 TaxID=3154464 RepID=UPI0034546BF6